MWDTYTGFLPHQLQQHPDALFSINALGLVYGADGKKRTLYSWRHFYATLDLQRGVSTHVLSRQMGNSTSVLDRFYSKLSPFMNPGLHSGRDLQRSTASGAGSSDRAAGVNLAAIAALQEDAVSIPVSAAQPVSAPLPTAHAKAFDLFDAGKLSETALLAAVGVARTGFELAEELRMRTLTAFEEGRLSEEAMIKLLS